MILFTLDTKFKQIYRHLVGIYSLISLICFIFPVIYERFAFGQYSNLMRIMGCFPLLSAGLFLVALFKSTTLMANKLVRYLWHSAIAIYVSGCLVTGIIEISGRTTHYAQTYFLIATLFILASISWAVWQKYRHPYTSTPSQ